LGEFGLKSGPLGRVEEMKRCKLIACFYFLLDQKVTKNQDGKKMVKNITHSITEIELTRIYFRNSKCGLKQQFLFNIELVHSLYTIFLRSWRAEKILSY
jgi:hypothetical protein